MSCTGEQTCAAVDSKGNAVTWNGLSWSTTKDIDGSAALSSVLCVSAYLCQAVDGQGNAIAWNGTSWSAPTLVDSGNALTAVSCPVR